jgi:hypothetical protein
VYAVTAVPTLHSRLFLTHSFSPPLLIFWSQKNGSPSPIKTPKKAAKIDNNFQKSKKEKRRAEIEKFVSHINVIFNYRCRGWKHKWLGNIKYPESYQLKI